MNEEVIKWTFAREQLGCSWELIRTDFDDNVLGFIQVLKTDECGRLTKKSFSLLV
ncbi:Hypothetical protein HVR_LOCUS794 [uncultured virus]|nr:Hypothetical protein HVR_LOCUS794 [uncultured virus]